MEPGFMLDIAENTGDGFSYVLLPVRSYVDILTQLNPTTLVRSGLATLLSPTLSLLVVLKLLQVSHFITSEVKYY